MNFQTIFLLNWSTCRLVSEKKEGLLFLFLYWIKVAKFISHCLFKNQTSKNQSQNYKKKIFRVKKLDTLVWNCSGSQSDLSTVSFNLNCSGSLGSQSDLSTVSFNLNCSVLYLTYKRSKFFQNKTDWLQSELFLESNSPRLDQNQPCYCCSSTKNTQLFWI